MGEGSGSPTSIYPYLRPAGQRWSTMEVIDTIGVGAGGGLPAGDAFDLTALAYHEAGHAVAAHLLDWRLVSVTINDQGGCCASRPGLRVRSRPLSGAALQRDRQRMAAD